MSNFRFLAREMNELWLFKTFDLQGLRLRLSRSTYGYLKFLTYFHAKFQASTFKNDRVMAI